MTTPTNWPNPERPGVPMFPERDGAHAFEYDNDSDLLIVYHWDSEESCWLEFPKGSRKEWDKRPDLDGLKYHGPCLTPTHLTELLAGEREMCAQATEKEKPTMDDASRSQCMNSAFHAISRAAANIRNLGAAS